MGTPGSTPDERPTVADPPALTHQVSTGVGSSAAGGRHSAGPTGGVAAGRSTASTQEDWPPARAVGPGQRESQGRSDRARATDRPSASPRVRASQRDRQRPAGLSDRGTTDRPDLDLHRPAPTVDATRGEEIARQGPPERETGPRADRRSGDREEGGGGTEAERAIEETFLGNRSEPSVYSADVDRIVDRLYREVERKMQIERERRGL
ncbi:MAG: hypothetical protein V5A43_09565 [Haloarculaceae archaeon]